MDMKRPSSFDQLKVTRLADNAVHMTHELRRTAAGVKAFALEVREIYYVVSPLFERFKSK